MNLDRFLRITKTTSRQFAEAVKVSIPAVRKWRIGARTPRGIYIRKIERFTNGKVKPKDWFQ